MNNKENHVNCKLICITIQFKVDMRQFRANLLPIRGQFYSDANVILSVKRAILYFHFLAKEATPATLLDHTFLEEQ